MKYRILLCSGWMMAIAVFAHPGSDIEAGPAYSTFQLTLTSGYRTEAAGPLYYTQDIGSQSQWALPPFYCSTETPDVDWSEMEILYPILSYRRFGAEYRWQFFELISFSGGRANPKDEEKKFTIFPFYFQQRGPQTNLNYTAVMPFYGNLQNRLFRDQIHFIMFPIYSQTRKKDVITDNWVYPIFDVRRGDHLTGWQVWPAYGEEHKGPTFRTNTLDEVETIGGYDKYFAVWPFYFKTRSGLGTTNVEKSLTVVPAYSHTKSATREETSYGFPFGYNVIDDREKHYVEHDVFWPMIVKARGEKEVTRVFPFYSQAHNKDLESDFYLWPIYKYNQLNAPPLERRRTRILFFLYSNIAETNKTSGEWTRRADFWPFYTYHREADGNERLQVLAVLEPFFPNNRAIPREYSPVWSFWRWEKNPKTGASSKSLLWNLYRGEARPGAKNFSLFFGLFQYQSGPEGRRWRVCHVTVKQEPARVVAPKS